MFFMGTWFLKHVKRNEYWENLPQEIIKDLEIDVFYFNDPDKETDYWKYDHEVMQEFMGIDEIPQPQQLEEIRRIENDFQYHSQLLQFAAQSNTLIGEKINELLFILQRVNK